MIVEDEDIIISFTVEEVVSNLKLYLQKPDVTQLERGRGK